MKSTNRSDKPIMPLVISSINGNISVCAPIERSKLLMRILRNKMISAKLTFTNVNHGILTDSA
ncbi:hypothetical protein D3C71_1853710 [compost metagenome]